MSDYSKVIEKVKPSIAFIIVVKDGAPMSQGTGFVFLEKNVLITCNHVIDCSHDSILIKFPTSEEKWITAKIAIQDKEHDLALLKFEDDSPAPLSKADETTIQEGMEILMSGYPLSITALTSHQGILSAITKDDTGMTTYLIDGTVNPGNSGCPLMNNEGAVIGVVNATRREQYSLISKVEDMVKGAISIHGVDLVEIHQALIRNLQLGMGYAVPCGYIPANPKMNDIGKEKKSKN